MTSRQDITDVTAPAYLDIHSGWAELVLNRPARKNAIIGPMGDAIANCLNALEELDDVRVVLLRGADNAFCSGLDIGEFNADPEPPWLADFQSSWRAAHRALFNTSKTTIGVLQRYAINGGAALALACDLLAVGNDAYLQVGEVQIGMAAPYNLAWLSLRHTESVTATLALLGERLGGPELVRLGVAQLCVDDAQLLQRGRQLAEQLAGYEGHGLKRIKAGMRARSDITADAWFDRFTLANPSSAKPRPKASPNPHGAA